MTRARGGNEQQDKEITWLSCNLLLDLAQLVLQKVNYG